MIGSKSFEIDASDFIKGMSSSNFISDGGFSNRGYGVNITSIPGLLYAAAQPVDQTDQLIGTLRASCEDPRVFTSGTKYQRVFAASDGTYYGFDGTTMALLDTDSTNPTKYGRVDMIAFGENTIYTTNEVAITSMDVQSGTVTDAFFVFAGSYGPVVPHPALVFENNAYYGNGNTLLRQTTVGGTPTVILTLPTEQTIIALGIDPGSGRMLISIIDGLNASGALNRTARVGYYDGFSNKLLKVVLVDTMITAFYPMGGTMYITYGKNFGYWTGSGIQFLRALDIGLVSTELAYKQHLTNDGTVLYIIEGSKVLAYDEVIKGQPKVFWYPYNNFVLGVETDMSMICSLGSGVLGYGYVNASVVPKFETFDTTDLTNSGQNTWYTNKYTFPRDVTFNGVLIEYGAALPTNGTAVGIFSLFNDKQVQTFIPSLSGVTNTQANRYTVELDYPSIQTRSLQFRYTNAAVGGAQYPIRRITVFYSPKE